MAAGHPPPTPKLNFGGIYVNTSNAKVGDRGSEVLKPAPSGSECSNGLLGLTVAATDGRPSLRTAVWSAGESYEVSWTIEANQ